MGLQHEQPIRSDYDIVDYVGLRRGNDIFIADVHTVEQQLTYLDKNGTETQKIRRMDCVAICDDAVLRTDITRTRFHRREPTRLRNLDERRQSISEIGKQPHG